MSTSITFPLPDGATYVIPAVDDENWGQNVSDFLIAIPAGVPPRSGTFSLTGDLSFGATYGLISQYYKSPTINVADAGILRLAKTDAIEWRNNTNGGNLPLAIDTSNNLTFNGHVVGTSSGGAVTSITGTANQIIASASTGAVTLSAPQDLNTTSSPSFATLTATNHSVAPFADLTNTTNQLVLGTTNTTTISATAPAASRVYTIPDVGGAANIILDKGNYTLTGTWTNATLVTPALGTPTAGVLSSCTGLPLTTGVTGTLPVGNGGTNNTSFTAYTVICAGTTSTGAFQNVASVGSSGQVLTSNGAGNLPTFQNAAGTGTVNSGTANNLAYYATSTNAVSTAANTLLNAAGYLVGNIVQIVPASTTTSFSTTSGAYGDTHLAASITPKAATNKIFIISQNNVQTVTGSTALIIHHRSVDGAVYLTSETELGPTSAAGARECGVLIDIDPAGSTNSRTYTTQLKSNGGGSVVHTNTGTSTMYLLEIGA